MTVGLITHLRNATLGEARSLAAAAEEAGADWLGVPDAFWWRDTWIIAAEAARATKRIEIGPLVTNPYTRHPLQTISTLATVQEIAGPRIFLGIGAGGSELTGVAGIDRDDAGPRIEALVDRLRAVADGAPLDERAARRLEVPLSAPPVLIAGRAARVLEAAGRVGDRALLWAVPTSELERSVRLVADGAADGRRAAGAAPQLIWAPLVPHDDDTISRLRAIAAYAVLNSPPRRKAAWGLSNERVAEIRRVLVGGGAEAATELIPQAALDDLVLPDPNPTVVGRQAAAIGATGIALPAFELDSIGERVEWARRVLAEAEAIRTAAASASDERTPTGSAA
jgi:5,10-methylenetetrahydromethanopterin reductase